MAFRRQDIPRTIRKGEDGEPRRVYPRFAKDRTLPPKVELAIGYLDGMVGRRRGDLTPEAILGLFGDPRLARCLLACLGGSYRYRPQDFIEVVGEEAAGALAAWDLLTPADLRAHVYAALNATAGGVVTTASRPDFLAETAAPLGLSAVQLETLLMLDAERNALLVRAGERPSAEDVLAQYNATLAFSMLRQSASVTLDLPGVDVATIQTICARHEVTVRREGTRVKLAGRRGAFGSWAPFGARVARCALHLLMLAPTAPGGNARIHLTDEPLNLVLDGPLVAAIRPETRTVANAEGVVRAAVLADDLSALRRKAGSDGWTMRRAMEPFAAGGAVILPELLFTRDQMAVAVVPVPTGGAERMQSLAALERIAASRSVIALGAAPGEAAVPSLATPDAMALLRFLAEIEEQRSAAPTPLRLVAEEARATGWVAAGQLRDLFGADSDVAVHLEPLTAEGEAVLIPGFGLCHLALLDDLLDQVADGLVEVGSVRAAVAAHVGDGPGADALTLHLLSRHTLVARGDAVAA